MACDKEFFAVYSKLPASERTKPILTYQNKTYTWGDLARLFRENPQLACYLWQQYKSVVAQAPSVTIY